MINWDENLEDWTDIEYILLLVCSIGIGVLCALILWGFIIGG